MTFTELCSLYEVYKNMYTKTATAGTLPMTVTQAAPAQAPYTVVPAPSAPATPTTPVTNIPAAPSIGGVETPAPASSPAPVSNNDLMAMLQAMQVPTVRGEAPKPESIDDVICRIAGIETNTEKK